VLALAERLVGLDLPDRATGVLRRALEGAPPGPARAGIGLRLATLRLAEGDAAGALGTLAGSAAAPGVEPLPAELARARAVLAARAEFRRGNLDAALGLLQPLGAQGLEAAAELLAEARDWQGAARALEAHLRAAVPPEPAPLGEAERRALLRQAALLALAGDTAGIASLRAAHAARMAAGPLAAPFAALTADPLRGLADLPRLQRELQFFRSFPSGLEPLRAASLGTR
jgi:hypothetical protein